MDTSGSIDGAALGQFFGELESATDSAVCSLLQWDMVFQSFAPRYRRGQWHSIEVKGRGGTAMDEAVYWLENNNLVGDVCILLTDGYTQWPTKKSFPFITCITTDAPGPDWGRVIRLK